MSKRRGILIGLLMLVSCWCITTPAQGAITIVNTATVHIYLVASGLTSVGDTVSDTAIVNVYPAETLPVWIAGVSVEVTVTETQVMFTFSPDTGVDTYCLVKYDPAGGSETFKTAGSTYTDININGDTIYYYAVYSFTTGVGTGTLSDSVAVGITEDGILFSPSMSDSTVLKVVMETDTRAFIRVSNSASVFGSETEIMKLTIKRIPLDQLSVPYWAKRGIASAYEISCKRWISGTYITQFDAPIDLTFAYDILRNKVVGTNIKTADILNRLSNFRWTGTCWSKLASATDLDAQTLLSQTDHLSYFGVCDIRVQQAQFRGYGAQPNPFSPNDDGINDAVYCKFPTAEEVGTFHIFDLNGAVIYKETIASGESQKFWTGYYSQVGAGRTDIAEAGAYIWQAKIGINVYNGIVVLVK